MPQKAMKPGEHFLVGDVAGPGMPAVVPGTVYGQVVYPRAVYPIDKAWRTPRMGMYGGFHGPFCTF